MIAELQSSIGNDVLMGLAQAAGAIALCAAVVVLCRWQAVRVEREAAVSMARGLVQMIFVGMVLALLLHGSLLIGSLILLLMTVAAAFTAARRLRGIEGAHLLCFWAIAAGGGTVIAAMLATRSLQPDISVLVPVGSMIIANAMNACAQAVERLQARSKQDSPSVQRLRSRSSPTFRALSTRACCPGSTCLSRSGWYGSRESWPA
jgi:putative ABC transport system permease protein